MIVGSQLKVEAICFRSVTNYKWERYNGLGLVWIETWLIFHDHASLFVGLGAVMETKASSPDHHEDVAGSRTTSGEDLYWQVS